jgi:hypothetical protein
MRDTIPADTLATLVVGNYLSDDDTTPEDTDSGVITAIDQDEDGVVLVRWLTSYGGRREDSLAGVLHCLEHNLLRVVVRPMLPRPGRRAGVGRSGPRLRVRLYPRVHPG